MGDPTAAEAVLSDPGTASHPGTAPPEPLPCYRLFGLSLASDFPFANPLPLASGAPDLRFLCGEGPLPGGEPEAHTLRYQSPSRTADGRSRLLLHRLEGGDLLRFTGVADFLLTADLIQCQLREPAQAFWVDIQLLGTVLSYWLERRGILAFHASAVVIGERAVGFLASNGGGKTSLAATLLQGGHRLLTDDVLAVETGGPTPIGRPGYPSMRMWPTEAAHFVGGLHGLPLVHPELTKRRVRVGAGGIGRFCAEPLPLACLYLPERRDPTSGGTEIQISPLPPTTAVVEWVRQSFIPRLVTASGFQPDRLARLAQLAGRIPLRRLSYPSGFEHLPRVREAIERDTAAHFG